MPLIDHPKFIQIVAGTWRISSKVESPLQHSIYALSEEGEVYRFTRANGWQPLGQYSQKSGKMIKDNEDF